MATVTTLDIPDVLLIQLDRFADERGWLLEFWNRARLATAGLPGAFAQSNLAFSEQRVLRGLHYQQPHAQGKLITAVTGEIFDVAVDLRLHSPTFGRWVGIHLAAASGQAVYMPEGFAHGYQVVSASAHVLYQCTEVYHPEADRSVAYNDPELAIAWPLSDPILSPRDLAAPRLELVRATLSNPGDES